MPNPEIELKIPIADASAFERQVERAGFHLQTERTFEQNTLYDTPERTLRERGEILRVREYGRRWTVTHKRHPEREDLGSRYKVRIETETEVTDGDAMAEIFTRLGYGPAFRYEKFRTEWEHVAMPDVHLVLDETPIGIFAEIEGPTERIDRLMTELGIDPASSITLSYGKLFLEWKRRTGSPAENLTFDEVGMAAAAAR